MATTLTYHKVRFRLGGTEHIITTPRPVSFEELSGMLYYTRRLIGYTVFPRWSLARLFLADVVRTFMNQEIYKHELKKAAKAAISELDALEIRHAMEFDKDFIDIMTNSMSNKAIGKLNELRGSIGGALMNSGMKNYVLCSYPYTFLNLCYDNISHYDNCMKQVKERYELDLSKVFGNLRGSKTYALAHKMLTEYIKVTGEDIPKTMDYNNTGCIDKLNSVSRILLDAKNLHDAFMEAYNEMPEDKRDLVEEAMSIWLDEDDKDGKEKVIDKLSQKYKVTKAN